MKKGAENNNAIKVFCRMRPLNSKEKDLGGKTCLSSSDKAVSV